MSISEIPVIVENFISDSDADLIAKVLSELAVPVPNTNRRCALGFETSKMASEVDTNLSILPPNEDPNVNLAGLKVSQLLCAVRKEMEDFYGFEMDLANSSYTEFSEGTGIPMHSDSTKLDGSPFRDDGVPEELEMSAILYLNTGSGVDFSGGEIYFPNQEITFSPVKGSLIHFRGDVDHKHEVQAILSGTRKVLIYFYARKGNVSSERFFY